MHVNGNSYVNTPERVVSQLPDFTDEGALPQGDFALSLADLVRSFLVEGPVDRDAYPNQDAEWRRRLVENLEILVGQLSQVGITEIFVNRSFVEDKDNSNDVEGHFECEVMELTNGDLQRESNLLDPRKIWT